MPSAFPTWILFTCYFLNSWIWASLGQGSYPKAAVQVIPGNVIIKGGNLTFRCTGDISGVRFALYKNGTSVDSKDPTGNEAEFHFTNVQPDHAGTYNCRYHSNTNPPTYSDRGDPITIQVRDTFPKPLLQVSPGNVSMIGRNLTFRCLGEQLNMRFVLHKGSEELLRVEPPGNQAVFTITNMKREDEGRYDCLYRTKTGPLIYSDASDSRYIRVIDDDDDDDDDKEKYPDSTEETSNNGHDGQKKITPKPTDTPNTIQYTVIISVVCAALLLIVLIVTAVLYSRRRPKKTKGDIQKKGLCSIEGKAAALPETTYATIQKRKNPDATNVPEVRELEGTEDQEGLTYVTINQEACKKKRAAQPRSDQESTVYAAVNLH